MCTGTDTDTDTDIDTQTHTQSHMQTLKYKNYKIDLIAYSQIELAKCIQR